MALLEVEDLVVEFRSDYGDVRASDRVCFTVDTGEVVGLVGESGSGKTVTSKAILRLVEPESAIRSGRIRFRDRDVLTLSEEAMRDLARLRNRDDLPGSDVRAEPGAPDW